MLNKDKIDQILRELHFMDSSIDLNDEKLQEGLAEDILLHNDLLTNPRIFTINENFISPIIDAPFLEKEMLYSALQKNFKKDLSGIKINFKGNFWEVNYLQFTDKCHTLENIIKTIKNILQ